MTANIYKQHALEGCLLGEMCNLLGRKNALLSSQKWLDFKAPVTSSLTAVAPRIEAKPRGEPSS